MAASDLSPSKQARPAGQFFRTSHRAIYIFLIVVTNVALTTIHVLADELPLSRAVIVSEAYKLDDSPGCGAISILDVTQSDGSAVRSLSQGSISWLSADDQFRQVLGSTGQGNVSRLSRMQRQLDGTWTVDRLRSLDNAFSTYAGLLVDKVGDTFVVGITGEGATTRGVARYPLPVATDPQSFRSDILATSVYSREVVVRQLIQSPEGVEFLALADNGHLMTHRADDLSQPVEVLELPPIVATFTTQKSIFFKAAISPGGRYIAMGRVQRPELIIADRVSRKVRTIDASEWFTMTDGVAFNAGWENRDLIAIHGASNFGVFLLDLGDDRLIPLAIESISPVQFDASPHPIVGGPIEWSADGSRLVVGVSHGANEFAVFRVSDCGRTMVLENEWAVCPSDRNYPVDILTANGKVSPPPGWVSPCPTPVWDDVYAPHAPHAPHAPPAAPPTATSARPTQLTPESGSTAYFPALLRMSERD